MMDFLLTVLTQSLTFIPLAFGISISYYVLRATDMTIDGSFVIGASIFARLLTQGYHPSYAFFAALLGGTLAGMLVATIQRGGRVDPLLAGVLATFILTSVNLVIMGKPNINLLSQTTLFSHAFSKNEWLGWSLVSCFVIFISSLVFIFLRSHIGLTLRALGDNPLLLKRLGKNMEGYRMLGFALTNTLSAFAGCLTAQTIGFADINMGLGMTLTGIGAIILGHQLVFRFFRPSYFRVGLEFTACLIGVVLYFFSLNLLLRLDIDPIYLKMILGFILIIFLRTATSKKTTVSV